MKGPFKMKYKKSTFPFKTGDKVPTAGPMDGITGAELETKEEASKRYNQFTHTPSVAEVLRTRKGEEKPPRPKDPVEKFLDKHLPQ